MIIVFTANHHSSAMEALMKHIASVLTLLLLTTLTVTAQTEDASAGSVSDLKGTKRVYVDTGDDAVSRASIIKELAESGLDLEVVDTPETADTILRYNNAPVSSPRPALKGIASKPRQRQQAREPSSDKNLKGNTATMPSPGKGLIIVSKKDGQRVVLDIGAQKMPSVKTDQPSTIKKMPATTSTDFAKDFIKMYKTANAIN